MAYARKNFNTMIEISRGRWSKAVIGAFISDYFQLLSSHMHTNQSEGEKKSGEHIPFPLRTQLGVTDITSLIPHSPVVMATPNCK